MTRKKANILAFSAVMLAILDGFFKYLVIKRLSIDEGRLRFPFDISLHKNPGIAFDIPIPMGIIIIATIVISLALISFAIKYWQSKPDISTYLIIILSGALGNMFDRIINGFTTDYLIFFQTSAINISDILIVTGALLVFWYNTKRDGNSN
ncbi:hypothetical protein CO057_04525 [Candidatus Uhrbacteria bacterium CG_4_9_14_0_2_um_filter_41_50]|uniref:Uncharacterized protein n=1 Tax=Candidatus Uhrbacteria bacterium CG_4_9_14_0_2_um_filter_41_50 TaxID=1975031 RepID=A0A2M8EN41_9BACT|nr:MAG: hypothetical protein COZ45_01775 [Candidatus Uhrbacteria bacterium CG_4_10_14_3_um_filter_41_21]PIZ55180.1 MAG: hypothetical protein COY24_01470 [Candidatus Uhrbacteria bacterium CG_4_10_14_0_2_um_filter_41_21]PJB84888.1 MAG: hypothetical protein CO086_01330 [Candidatus Uhrbacteria bacterium CG_4_9_14_0_8_um_filter_41_16]PJC24148.1 MAG: hypothetical protein CO057_04525 [Candidatus Uhrbacteria bacterium CG_4_9_14_0_2_um_filter_41_50]PJE75037.1 MAG: hypothetical protein COV03_02395 [Candi